MALPASTGFSGLSFSRLLFRQVATRKGRISLRELFLLVVRFSILFPKARSTLWSDHFPAILSRVATARRETSSVAAPSSPVHKLQTATEHTNAHSQQWAGSTGQNLLPQISTSADASTLLRAKGITCPLITPGTQPHQSSASAPGVAARVHRSSHLSRGRLVGHGLVMALCSAWSAQSRSSCVISTAGPASTPSRSFCW